MLIQWRSFRLPLIIIVRQKQKGKNLHISQVWKDTQKTSFFMKIHAQEKKKKFKF